MNIFDGTKSDGATVVVERRFWSQNRLKYKIIDKLGRQGR